jgi:hypothetical protein
MVDMLCTHVWKWKNEACRNYSKNGGGIKANDGGDEFNDDILQSLLWMSQLPPVQEEYDNKFFKRLWVFK